MTVQPINSYRAYGEYHPQSEDDALVKKADTADTEGQKFHIYQEAFPAGIELNGSTFGVAEGYDHHIFGKYAFSPGRETSKDSLVLRVKKMCVVVGANSAIINFSGVPNEHQDRAQAIEAILVNLGEKEKDDKTETPWPD